MNQRRLTFKHHGKLTAGNNPNFMPFIACLQVFLFYTMGGTNAVPLYRTHATLFHGFLYLIRQMLKCFGHDLDLVGCFFPVSAFDGFADGGEGFDAVAGVEAGGIDLVAEPRAAGETGVGD